jgi:hypothetical protein
MVVSGSCARQARGKENNSPAMAASLMEKLRSFLHSLGEFASLRTLRLGSFQKKPLKAKITQKFREGRKEND